MPLIEVLSERFSERFSERQRAWAVRSAVCLVGMFWLLLLAATWSRAAEVDSSPQPSDEYNFKWLDPEKKIYVLQNRRYQKANRLSLSLTGGPEFGNAYRTSWALTPRMDYFFSESWGIEVFYNKTFNSPNNTYNALTQTGASVYPVIREVSNVFGGILYWSPWYAKINVFNEILYFDWLFGVGGGEMSSNLTTLNSSGQPSSVTSSSQTVGIATTGQQFYLNERFIIRWDLTGMYYSSPVYGTSGSSSMFSDYRFELGFGVRL
ncbi:MAG: outer membrane beta-barrel domain-containing protein [Oligoflexia bacterium]|nr:outer membrane beta-barrel domain-containing protein [Oligoflexia bacterium]